MADRTSGLTFVCDGCPGCSTGDCPTVEDAVSLIRRDAMEAMRQLCCTCASMGPFEKHGCRACRIDIGKMLREAVEDLLEE